jgi:hypothetical protein
VWKKRSSGGDCPAAWKKTHRAPEKQSGRKLFAEGPEAGSALQFDKSLQRHTLSAKLNKRIPSNDSKEEVFLTHAFVHRRGAHIPYKWIPIVRALAFMLLNPVRSLYIRQAGSLNVFSDLQPTGTDNTTSPRHCEGQQTSTFAKRTFDASYRLRDCLVSMAPTNNDGYASR